MPSASPATADQQDSAYRAIFDASSDGLVINDAETGRVLEANPAFCQMHGYRTMIGLHPTTFIHPNSHGLFAEYLRVVSEGREFRTRAQDVRSDGSVFDVEVLGRGFTYQGRFALLGVVRDVTEQVRAYQALEERVKERTREVDRRREVAEALRDLIRTINSTRSLEEILPQALAQASRLLGSDAAAIYVPDASRTSPWLRVAASTGLKRDYAALGAAVGTPVTGLAFTALRPVAVYDVRAALTEDEAEAATAPLDERTSHLRAVRVWCGNHGPSDQPEQGPFADNRAVLAVPLAANDVTYGCLTLLYREPRDFSHDEVWLAAAFADQAALAVQNARLHEESENRRRELEALYEADRLLHRSLRQSDVLQALVDTASSVLNADKSSVLVWNDDRTQLEPGATRGFRAESVAQMIHAPGHGVTTVVALTGHPVIVSDASNDPRVAHHITGPEGIHSLMHVPVRAGNEIFGVFGVNYCAPHEFSTKEQRLLEALADRAGLAIQNARLYEQAQLAATLEERQRLARELHDAVTQTLFSASLIAEVAPRLWRRDPEEAHQRLEELRMLTRGALAEMRALLLELRPAALLEVSLDQLLRQLADATRSRSGLEVEVCASSVGSLPAEAQVALYRIAQEALNNIVKHARATRAELILRTDSPGIELEVADNGRGFQPDHVEAGHFGLGIMRERAEAIGASFECSSRVGEGTWIRVQWRQ